MGVIRFLFLRGTCLCSPEICDESVCWACLAYMLELCFSLGIAVSILGYAGGNLVGICNDDMTYDDGFLHALHFLKHEILRFHRWKNRFLQG